MGLKVYNGSAFVNATGLSVAANSSSWTNASAAAVYTGTYWHQFFPSVEYGDANITSSDTGSQTAGVYFLANGSILYQSTSAGNTVSQQWITPADYASSSYEVYATLDAGDSPLGTLNTWLSLDTDRSWRISSLAVENPQSSTLTITVRNVDVSNTEIESAVFNLFAERV